MMLYWAIFTLGFLFGAILSYMVFAVKKPEDDPEYETFSTTPDESPLPSTVVGTAVFEQTSTKPIIVN